jgi:uncharacterized protein
LSRTTVPHSMVTTSMVSAILLTSILVTDVITAAKSRQRIPGRSSGITVSLIIVQDQNKISMLTDHLDLIVDGLLVPVEKDGPEEHRKTAAAKLNAPETDISIVKILFKSLITTDKEQFYYEVSLVVRVPAAYDNKNNFTVYAETPFPKPKKVISETRPIIIGFGPAGMFAALELIERGQRPLIFERGKKLEDRHVDVRRFISSGRLAPESNIQFGEGGAGLYSDGKLFSRPNNSAYAKKVLDTFITFGAPPEIRYMYKPHLGTDVLCKIVADSRKYIISQGGEIHYGAKMTDILVRDNKAEGVVINGSAQYLSSSIYLAIGNSARDTFELLHEKGIFLEPKPVSVGVRIEHPARTINRMRYGDKYRDFPGLGAASYSFTFTNRRTRRHAYTFCMCPGGEVVNASSEEGMLALNGMSYSARNSAFSNSAIAVTLDATDYKSVHPLSGIAFQRDIEKKAFLAGGAHWKVPAQNLIDFLRNRPSVTLRGNSYRMGAQSAVMDSIFPAFICETLRAAFDKWKTESPLFVSDEVVLMGAETRTSAPVRMKRKKSFESVAVGNLYPIGEGSGYSGGINSAAIDAIRAVETVHNFC